MRGFLLPGSVPGRDWPRQSNVVMMIIMESDDTARGRAVHVHFKVRTAQGAEFTSQLYFDDALTDRVHAQAPYARPGQSRLRNEGDGLFRQGGRQLLVAAVPAGPGYAATFDIALGP